MASGLRQKILRQLVPAMMGNTGSGSERGLFLFGILEKLIEAGEIGWIDFNLEIDTHPR